MGKDIKMKRDIAKIELINIKEEILGTIINIKKEMMMQKVDRMIEKIIIKIMKEIFIKINQSSLRKITEIKSLREDSKGVEADRRDKRD